MLRLAVLTGALLALTGAGAEAATVQVVEVPNPEPKTAPARVGVIVVTAAGAEANDVALSHEPGTFTRIVRVRDAGAPLTAGDRCRAESDGAVRCDPGELGTSEVRVELGDGNDRLSGGELVQVVVANGGAGDDALTGGRMGDRLDGGEGADRLDGAIGNDSLQGGLGADELVGGFDDDHLTGDPPDAAAFAADRLDGGDGKEDHASYFGRAAPVTVDLLDPAGDGAPGENDVITGVEWLTGGFASDVLNGGGADETIRGGAGDDRIGGGPGFDRIFGEDGDDTVAGGRSNDVIEGGLGDDRLDGEQGSDTVQGDEGADRLVGGTGIDLLDARDGRDTDARAVVDPVIDCGEGRGDRLYGPSAREAVPPDCEAVAVMRNADVGPVAHVSGTLRRRRGGLFLNGSCRSELPCTARVVVREASSGRLLGSGRRRSVGLLDMRLRLTRAGRRLLRGDLPALRISVRVVSERFPTTVSFVTDPGP